ncbi:MAG: hypothetical protein P1U78_14095, partial [Alcanivoracaceae bacterium]|nr:hypothetical protein [Alcanivoracaceae bacterium]
GIGKSLSCFSVLHRYWKLNRDELAANTSRNVAESNSSPWLPVLLTPALSHDWWSQDLPEQGIKYALQHYYNLPDNQLPNLQDRPVLFVLDAYDEILATWSAVQGYSLLQMLGLSADEWPQARLLVTCRSSQYATLSAATVFGAGYPMCHISLIQFVAGDLMPLLLSHQCEYGSKLLLEAKPLVFCCVGTYLALVCTLTRHVHNGPIIQRL